MSPWTPVILTFVVGVVGLYFTSRQILSGLDRARREKAIDMLMKWSEFNQPETSSVTRLIESLDDAQCLAISTTTTLEINVRHHDHLVNILQLRFPDIDKQLTEMKKGRTLYQIEGRYLLYIRYIAVRYLNMLESILSSWSSGIADREIIKHEFSFLFDPTKSKTAMAKLREKLGNDSFPAINLFINELKSSKETKNNTVWREMLSLWR
jgi:hypothetical protein